MRISLNEIKKLVKEAAEVDADEIIKLIGSRLVEVEEKIDLAPKYAGIYIVKVVECEAIPETHLHLCQIETPEKVQVVCGAPNVRAGMLAVWVAPGSIVPQTYGEENFKLDVRKLRGYESHGMLAAIDELDLGDDHEGIAEIDPSLKNQQTGELVKPGDSFAEVFDLNDIILDIENKSLTHRPDCFGLVGFAREVAGILGVEFDNGNWFANDLQKVGENVDITISDPKICQRYSCAVLEVKDALEGDKYLTPMDIFLAKADMRGISKIVDVTNYLMLMTGQPLHAFDYDKFLAVGGASTAKVGVRLATNGEKLQLLDGKTIDCNENDIVITSNNIPVALAGAMGGASTEIDASTSRVLLESATFSLYNLRKTQMAHGIFSEAITRFTKGQPAFQTTPVLADAVAMLNGNVVATGDEVADKPESTVVKITTEEINSLLGTSYDTDLIVKTLSNVGFTVNVVAGGVAGGTPDGRSEASTAGESATTGPAATLTVKSPLWRTDIHIKEDIIEEVGRLLGYDNIPLNYPTKPFIGAKTPELLDLKNKIRSILSDKLNAHEVLTYTFVSKNLQEQVGEDPNDSYEIVNSISPELQRFRQTITPSLLEKVRDNLKSGYKDFSLYEINQVSKQSYGKDEDGVPQLYTHLAFVTVGDFYKMKANLVALLKDLGFDTKKLDFRAYDGHFPYLESLRSTTITTPHICAGEVKKPVLKRLKISETVSAFEISLDDLIKEIPEIHASTINLSKFPSVERDITVKIAADTPFSAAEKAIEDVFVASDLDVSIQPVSLYQPEGDTKNRNLSFHVEFKSTKKTLESAEISAIMEKVSENVKQAVGAEII